MICFTHQAEGCASPDCRISGEMPQAKIRRLEKERDVALADLERVTRERDAALAILKGKNPGQSLEAHDRLMKLMSDGYADRWKETDKKLAAAQAELVALRRNSTYVKHYEGCPALGAGRGVSCSCPLEDHSPTVAQPLLDALAEAHRAWSFFFGFLDREAVLQDWPGCLADIIEARQAIAALASFLVKP